MYDKKLLVILFVFLLIMMSCQPSQEVPTETATSTIDFRDTKTYEAKAKLTFDKQATSDAKKTADALSTTNARETLEAGETTTASYQDTQTAVFKDNLTKTAEAKVSTTTAIQQSTADAAANLLNTASIWGIAFSDSFSKPSSIWTTYYNKEDEYYFLKAGITDGKYRIEDQAKISHRLGHCFSKQQSDFYLTFEGAMVEGAKHDHYGINFRFMDNGRYYGLLIRGDQYYSLIQQKGENVYTLIGWTFTENIYLDQVNRITVIAQGDHFSFYVNDNFIAEYADDNYGASTLCLEVGVTEGEKGVFEFDNIELRVN